MDTDVAQSLGRLYAETFGSEAESCVEMGAHASKRRIFRLSHDQKSAIGVVNQDLDENDAFVGFSKHFRSLDLPVPEVYAYARESALYLVEDLGEDTLLDVLNRERQNIAELPERVEALYRQALQWLVQFQITGAKGIDYGLCHQRDSYNRESMLWDMRFFERSFVNQIGVKFDQELLHQNFDAFCDFLLTAPSDYFLYRDFQSRNIMVCGDKLYFIDYQAGRRGPLQYDVVSLLFQAQAQLPADVRERLLYSYLDALEECQEVSREEFIQFYYSFVIVRIMQTLGVYGEQGLRQGKDYFTRSIPLAIANVKQVLSDHRPPCIDSELYRVFIELIKHYD